VEIRRENRYFLLFHLVTHGATMYGKQEECRIPDLPFLSLILDKRPQNGSSKR
jgi:hypothetical protein